MAHAVLLAVALVAVAAAIVTGCRWLARTAGVDELLDMILPRVGDGTPARGDLAGRDGPESGQPAEAAMATPLTHAGRCSSTTALGTASEK